MPSETTNMIAQLPVEEAQIATREHVANITLPNKRTLTANKSISEPFQDYIQVLFTRKPDLSPVQFDAYLTVFSRLEGDEAPGCDGPIIVIEIWGSLKRVGKNKSPGLNGFACEMYMRESPVLSLCCHLFTTTRCIRGLYLNASQGVRSSCFARTKIVEMG